MSYNDLFQIDATMVANEFLDKYMPSANGDYVKVYLYLLRNRVNGVDVETIAEQLQLTEGDVRRAIKYWEKCGIVAVGNSGSDSEEQSVQISEEQSASAGKTMSKKAKKDTVVSSIIAEEGLAEVSADSDGDIRSRYRRADGKEALNRLSSDDDFKQLLFIVQKYRSKILTESEEQVLAYLYDGLHLPCEVLDYLVQYCVENNHSSMRYIEKTGLDWATLGIRTVKEAQRRTKQFDEAKTATAKKTTARKDKAGITRKRDLDAWLNDVVQRNIQ